MKGPMLIGLVIGLTWIAGCSRKPADVGVVSTSPEGTSPDLTWSIKSSNHLPATSSNVPVDDQAKRLGKKVFAKATAIVRRRPQEGSEEYYRVTPGTALFVSPTADKKWLQVRMSKGKTGYVRTDETTAELALALAQSRLEDKQRLSPRPKPDSEPDDGKANEPNSRDIAVDQAIERVNEALAGAEEGFDRLRAEAAGFQGPSENWPTVQTAVSQELTLFQNQLQELATAIQSLTALSGKLTANERSAFQTMVGAQADATDLAQDIRQTLNQMSEGSDGSSLIATLDDQMRSLASAMDALRSGLGRL